MSCIVLILALVHAAQQKRFDKLVRSIHMATYDRYYNDHMEWEVRNCNDSNRSTRGYFRDLLPDICPMYRSTRKECLKERRAGSGTECVILSTGTGGTGMNGNTNGNEDVNNRSVHLSCEENGTEICAQAVENRLGV